VSELDNDYINYITVYFDKSYMMITLIPELLVYGWSWYTYDNLISHFEHEISCKGWKCSIYNPQSKSLAVRLFISSSPCLDVIVIIVVIIIVEAIITSVILLTSLANQLKFKIWNWKFGGSILATWLHHNVEETYIICFCGIFDIICYTWNKGSYTRT
jgi:hypothetical protein